VTVRRTSSALAGALLATGALAAAPAHAVTTDFGNGSCSGTDGIPGSTTVYTAKGAGNPLPVSAPQTGVITKARFALPQVEQALSITVKVVRPAAAANEYTVVAQSAPVAVGSGTQTYDVRVPVTAGDLLGTGGSFGLFCTGAAGDVAAIANADVAPGTTRTYETQAGLALPLVVSVEPDADKDGYGDETQDKCPQSAATQVACPVAKIDTLATVAKNKVTVVVTTDTATTASATGSVKVGKKPVTLTGGPAQVVPGTFGRLTVAIPRPVRKALAALPTTKGLKVTFTVTASNVAGAPTTDTVTVKLPGRAR
jgi:hypothetical protein